MMVYMVWATYDHYEPAEVVAAFSSRESADNLARKINERLNCDCDMDGNFAWVRGIEVDSMEVYDEWLESNDI